MVEHLFCTQVVEGSSPFRGSKCRYGVSGYHMTLPMSRGQFKSDYLLKKCGIGVSGNISAFQAEVDSSSLLFHSKYRGENWYSI